jgi:hypothetical protein
MKQNVSILNTLNTRHVTNVSDINMHQWPQWAAAAPPTDWQQWITPVGKLLSFDGIELEGSSVLSSRREANWRGVRTS